MKKPANGWPDTELSRSVLFFAQLVRELLDPEAFESNRVFSLDTIARLNECIELHGEFSKKNVSKKVLNSALEEARWSLSVDPIANILFSDSTKRTLDRELRDVDDVHRAKRALVYARNRLKKTYQLELEKLILSSLSSNRRRNLRIGTSFYCSFLVNIGYSRSYISEVAKEIFFDPKVHKRVSSGKIKSFFRKFSSEDREFYVYAAVTIDFGTLLKDYSKEIKQRRQRLNHQDAQVKKTLKITQSERYAFFVFDAKDPFSAAKETNEFLGTFRALALLNPHASDVDWQKSFYVSKVRERSGKNYVIPTSPVNWLSPRSEAAPRILNDIRRYSTRIVENFEFDSFFQILRSVQTAAGARYSTSVESQLVSLWTAVEALVGEPADDSPRIVHFAERILPSICRRHLHRRSIDLYENLCSEYKPSKVNRIVTALPQFQELGNHFSFSAIFMLEEHANFRSQLCSLASDNPLALHRMWQFYEDCKDPGSVYKCVMTHRKRVRWQLHRIYRARNALVHRASPPHHLDGLVLNLFEYYIRALSSVVKAASAHEDEVHLDDIFSEIQVESLAVEEALRASKDEPEMSEHLFRAVNT